MPVEDLGFDVDDLLQWFSTEQRASYTLVRVDEKTAQVWAERLKTTLRRCYARDALIKERTVATGLTASDVVSAFLPERGSIKAGDFGEILAYLYHAAEVHPATAVGPKKWRMKSNFNAAAPGSDVVQFLLPTWPTPSSQDVIICAEVKTKSTVGPWSPVASAIEGCTKDRTSRLASTLVWLKNRAIVDDVSGVDLDTLNRFVKPDINPVAEKRFRAIVLVEASLLEPVLQAIPEMPSDDFSLVVIAFPGLYDAYNEVFGAAIRSITPLDEGVSE